jgi:LmbE family N-acetylglucosaminyl deacetylase
MSLTILAVGAHMDDSEYGIGGILIQAVRAGHRVVIVVTVSDYTTWGSTIGREEQCKKDQLALAEHFGYEKRFLDYPYHQFLADVEAKKKLARIYVELHPDITFVMNTEDHWPDHVYSGIAAKDAVIFSHGLTEDLSIRRCPRVFAYNSTPGQCIRFEPDFFVDVSDVMPQYMELLMGTDGCLRGRPPEEMARRRITDLQTGTSFQVSAHGWLRLVQCAQWGAQNGTGPYAIGLRTLWGPRDGRPLWQG